ncbi:MAG: hypothetical protein HFJ72_06510 [Adlercreutzia sp.]|nr:hypothetical protein [Adlercreutzia sp.]
MTTLKKTALMAGTAALAVSGLVAPAAAAVAQEIPGNAPAVETSDVSSPALENQQARAVEGSFSFTQNAVTENATITSVFSKAAAALCQAMPDYAVQQLAASPAIQVENGQSGHTYAGTVADMSSEEGSQSFVMACSCASNVAGGGAMANADVSGVSLASIVGLVAAAAA